MNTSYFDLYDNLTELKEDELSWFLQICEFCKAATGIYIPIECEDHSVRSGKSKEALGILHTDNPNTPLNGDTFITIDSLFIHECYEEVFEQKLNLSFENLEHVIAHEFAHCYQWRHCKKHAKITEEIYQKIKKYQELNPEKL